MITEQQQKTLNELRDAFEGINALDHDAHDIFAAIDKDISEYKRKKGIRDASKIEAYAKGKSLKDDYYYKVVRPTMQKYFPDFPMGFDISHSESGRLAIRYSHSTEFEMKPKMVSAIIGDVSGCTEFQGFYVKTGFKEDITFTMADFNNNLAKFVSEVLKSKIGY